MEGGALTLVHCAGYKVACRVTHSPISPMSFFHRLYRRFTGTVDAVPVPVSWINEKDSVSSMLSRVSSKNLADQFSQPTSISVPRTSTSFGSPRSVLPLPTTGSSSAHSRSYLPSRWRTRSCPSARSPKASVRCTTSSLRAPLLGFS